MDRSGRTRHPEIRPFKLPTSSRLGPLHRKSVSGKKSKSDSKSQKSQSRETVAGAAIHRPVSWVPVVEVAYAAVQLEVPMRCAYAAEVLQTSMTSNDERFTNDHAFYM